MIERLPASVGVRITRAQLVGDYLVFGTSNAALHLGPLGTTACKRALENPVSPASDQEVRLFDRIAAHRSLSIEVLQTGRDPGLVTVVIPVYNNAAGLERLLGSLAGLEGLAEVIVVDDCSDDMAEPIALAARFGAKLHRLETNLGPAAARNAGAKLAGSKTQVLVFMDADLHVSNTEASLMSIRACQAGVGFAAPRVRSGCAGVKGRIARWIAHYEWSHSPLDMGSNPALIDGAGPIWYVPSAMFAIRVELFDELGGFRESLRYGEDVDLVARAVSMGAIGYFSGESGAFHEARTKLLGFVAQRFHYGASASPLARIHPGRVVHFSGDEISVAALIMPGASMTIRSAILLKQHRALRTSLPDEVSAALANSSAQAVLSALQNELEMIGRMALAPLVAASLFSSLIRRHTARLLVLRAGIAFALAITSKEGGVAASAAIEATPTAILAVIDDLAYSAGLGYGALMGKSLAAYRARFRPGAALATLRTRGSTFRRKTRSDGA